MSLQIKQVDAFSSQPFRGNPAGVYVSDSPRDEAWMQNVAAEMNLAETAFLVPQEGGFSLRWFTPATEVPLCGHATVASAHALWEDGRVAESEAIRFFTKSGELVARRDGEWITVDFPAIVGKPTTIPAELEGALGTRIAHAQKSEFGFMLVELGSEETVRGLKPNVGAIKAMPYFGVIATAEGSGAFDFVSRMFAPAVGIDEDPVTGAAHCQLGPYWQSRLGKDTLLAHQASTRGGDVRVRVLGERVELGGQAVTVFDATLNG